MSFRPTLGTIGKICRKSPPKTMVFPLKIFPVACASSNCIKSRRINRNLEWAVLPPRSNIDAIPDEATASTILPCPRRRDRSVVQTNVLPVPPLPQVF
ncbi:hypothetical protein CY35_02G173000 [Sphagnum magellanicum]|nr:hypothetical protein CY35_02G173000 [Sphagnum magellanicum]